MAASAGTFALVGRSGRTYTIDAYVPDATGTFLTLNPSGLAGTGSPTHWTAPEDCVIKEFSVAAAPTAVGAIMQLNDASQNGATIRHANHLSSLAFRMKLNVPVPRGAQMSWLQF